ncbi:metallophosphoesterase family protein [Daejeonella sp.]|uniref:metallophosphoesterase family protein n=1 Tax=Daejeonella sp. TaxID=2805397 RepID=UPI0030BE61FD
MKLNLLLLSILAVIFSSSCRKFEYSPNQKFDKTTPQNINANNLQRLFATAGDDTIRFVLSGDSQNAYNDLGTFIDKVNAMPGIDFVILNGDISDFGLLQEFKWIENYFSKLKAPYLGVIGNHDHSGNGVFVYQRMFSEQLDFSFIYKGVKFVCHNTNSREYKFDGTVPNLNYLKNQFQPEAGVKGYFAIAHVPPTNADFDNKLFAEYGKILTDNGKVYAVLNAHIDKATVQYPYTSNLPIITTNSLYNRHFVVVEVVNNNFKFYNVKF